MNVVYALLICLALTAIELLIGGTRLLFALPAYGVLAFAGLLSLIDLRRPKLPANGWCLASSALFFGYILARTLTSPVEYIAWDDRFMVLAALIVYLLTACLLTDPRRRQWVLAALLALAVVNIVVGGRQFATGRSDMLFGFIRAAQYDGRASGLYICPDHLAGFLEVVGCLALATAIWSRNRPTLKLLTGYLALCCFAGLLITGSRGGYLAAAAGLGTMTLLGLLRVRAATPSLLPRVLLVLTITGAFAGGILFLTFRGSALLQNRAKKIVDRQEIRLLLWPAAVQQWETSPAFGTGAATYLYYGRRFRNPAVQVDPVRPHSDYLELLAEYGAVGAAGFLLFLFVHLGNGLRAFRHLASRPGGDPRGSNAAAWNIGCLSAVACLVIHSVVDFNLHIPANTLLLAFVFGQLANPGRMPQGEDQIARRRPVDWLARLALPALSVWLLAEGMPKLSGAYYAEKARVALRDGRLVAAVGFARQGLEHQQHDPLLYYYMGEARQLIAEKRDLGGQAALDDGITASFRRDALDAYQHALALAPNDSVLLMRTGEDLARFGRFDEAAPLFARLLTWDPRSANVQTYLGFYLQRAGRLDEAEAAYERAASLVGTPAVAAGLAENTRHPAALATPR